MSEEIFVCPSCKQANTLTRLPSTFSFDSKKEKAKRDGQLVEESIDEFRAELEVQKQDLKKEYVENNE